MTSKDSFNLSLIIKKKHFYEVFRFVGLSASSDSHSILDRKCCEAEKTFFLFFFPLKVTFKYHKKSSE